MGWWEQNEQGRSFAQAETEIMVWGDGPADIIDNAVDSIDKEFMSTYGRKATKAELLACLSFSVWDR